ncbi:hypothetical protein KY495_02870 [Massilia sp. PAMC28688]|uniref:substrate-binding periplasmic protein n=1 Tax=Massilia sp. PAMC28688 TaxID=2861283 RepID=UPI001C63096A|nr:hypothetical protein [Massilia sp. PAMC28688]QYF94187.1 hypothetical protein KY495_02870 [Massilia sp. PAMC28688]
MKLVRHALACAILASTALAPAAAGCSRPISVPVAASGHSVTISRNGVGGLFPEMLTLVGARAGCTFVWSVAPRVRQETMFASGQADILVAATQVERRDRHGIFIPMFETRPVMISVNSTRARLRSIDDLLARRDLRVVLVRGYDYGDAYRAMLATLQAQGRVYLQPDPQTVARMLAGSLADVTIMPASVFIAGASDDIRTADLVRRLRVEPLVELPWIKSGIYLSRTSLRDDDRSVLERELRASVRSGLWWQAMRRYYPRDTLARSTRPIGISPPPR